MRFAKTITAAALGLMLTAGCGQSQSEGESKSSSMTEQTTTGDTNMVTATDYRSIPLKTITGNDTTLAAFEGKVVLLVNVASKCGYTPQYEGLQELYTKYKDEGLVVVGIPANNFGGQEPGSDEEILEFCTSKFDVTFPMLSKISVKGDDKHPLYVYLTEQSPHPGEISWNFNKFLLDKEGKVVARYESKVTPMDQTLTSKVESLL